MKKHILNLALIFLFSGASMAAESRLPAGHTNSATLTEGINIPPLQSTVNSIAVKNTIQYNDLSIIADKVVVSRNYLNATISRLTNEFKVASDQLVIQQAAIVFLPQISSAADINNERANANIKIGSPVLSVYLESKAANERSSSALLSSNAKANTAYVNYIARTPAPAGVVCSSAISNYSESSQNSCLQGANVCR